MRWIFGLLVGILLIAITIFGYHNNIQDNLPFHHPVKLFVNQGAGTSSSTIRFELQNKSDTSFTSYKQLTNSTPDQTPQQGETLSLTNTGTQCYSPNWTTINYTRTHFLNGTWNFTVEGTCTSALATAVYFAAMFSLNSSGQRSWIGNTTVSANICSLTTETLDSWLWTAPASLNVTQGNTIGFNICMNVTGLAVGQTATLFWINESTAVFFTNTTDYTPPNIVFVTPTPNNNTQVADNSVLINATIGDLNSEIDTCLLEFNNSNVTMTKIGTGKNVNCEFNQTNLDSRTMTFKVYANDTEGNQNFSSQRNYSFTAGCGNITYNTNLVRGITKNGFTCFLLAASNIVIDCKNFMITSNKTNTPQLTYIMNVSGFNNITLKNCSAENFSNMVELFNAKNITLLDNRFRIYSANAGGFMVRMGGTGGDYVFDNNFFFATGERDLITSSAQVGDENITRNYINNTNAFAANGVAVANKVAGMANIWNNTIMGFFSAGIGITSSTTRVWVDNNTFLNNGRGAVSFSSTNGIRVTNNLVIGSGDGATNPALVTLGVTTNHSIYGNNVTNNLAPYLIISSAGNRFENNSFSFPTSTNNKPIINITANGNKNNITWNIFTAVRNITEITNAGDNVFLSNTYNNYTGVAYTLVGAGNNTLINESVVWGRNNISIAAGSTSFLNLNWIIDVNVSDSNGAAINLADVNISNRFGTLIFSGKTPSDGVIHNITINQSVFNATTEFNWTNHNITANTTVTNISEQYINESRRFLITLILSTCNYGGTGIFNVTCSDNCSFTANVNAASNISLIGTGALSLRANWTLANLNSWVEIGTGCLLDIYPNSGIN